MEDVNPSIKGIKPPVTLAQANAIAAQADGIPEGSVESPWAVAISKFKESHTVRDGKWVRKEGSKYGKKDVISDVAGAFIGVLRQLIGGDKARGEGQGVGKPKQGLGPTNKCVCPKCGAEYPHEPGKPCTEETCEKCGASLVGKDSKEVQCGFKAIEHESGNYLVLWTSNAFEDREKEIFATKAWENYVARRDVSGKQDRVRFWHVKGSEFATVVWQDMVGRILLEVAKVDDTPRGAKMFHAAQHPEEYPDLLPMGWGTSHGYLYRPGDKAAKVYEVVEKFESTILPFHRACNLYGGINSIVSFKEVIDMTVTDEKKKGLESILGKELTEESLEEALKASDLLEAIAAFKEKGDEEEDKKKPVPPVPPAKPAAPAKPPADEEEEEEEEDEDEEKEKEGGKETVFEMEMDDELLKEIAGHVNIDAAVEKAVKGLLPGMMGKVVTAVKEAVKETNVDSKEEIVQQAIAGKLRLVPYTASKDGGNTIDEKDLKQREKGEKDSRKDPVKAVVGRMLRGD
jgi:hypothetical protein